LGLTQTVSGGDFFEIDLHDFDCEGIKLINSKLLFGNIDVKSLDFVIRVG